MLGCTGNLVYSGYAQVDTTKTQTAKSKRWYQVYLAAHRNAVIADK